MRFSTAAALAAVTAPIAVSAKGGRLGFALGVRNEDKSCKTSQDFVKDFNVLKAAKTPNQVKIVRTYAAIDGGADDVGGPRCHVPGAILPAAKEAGIQVVLGLWADTDEIDNPSADHDKTFNLEVKEILDHVQGYEDTIYAFTVGSEGLYRYEQSKKKVGYTTEDLLRRINSFKQQVSSAPYNLAKKVGTADSWNKYQDGTADGLVTGGVDLLLVNAFGYWQSQDISNASATYLDDLQQAYGRIQSVSKSTTSIELWNGETGWPSDGGSDYHDPKVSTTAHASTENAKKFYKEGVCAALDWDFDVFYFEAFAEPWKPKSIGKSGDKGDETHWGAWDVQRNPVIDDLSCSYP